MNAKRKISAALAVLVGLFLGGCGKWPKDSTEFIHVNSRTDAVKIASAWAAAGGRNWSYVGTTGSMRPILNGGEITLNEKYVGQPITPGQIVIFYRDAGAPRVIHQVVEVKDGAAYLSGVNNRHSDGWYPLDRITDVVARVLTFPR